MERGQGLSKTVKKYRSCSTRKEKGDEEKRRLHWRGRGRGLGVRWYGVGAGMEKPQYGTIRRYREGGKGNYNRWGGRKDGKECITVSQGLLRDVRNTTHRRRHHS